jgi:hypothetical protein
MTTQHDERAELICELEAMAVNARGVNFEDHPCWKAAALLEADGKAGGEVRGCLICGGLVDLSRAVKPQAFSMQGRPQPAAQVAQPLTTEKINNIKTHIAGLAFICEITDTGQLVDHVVRAVEAAHGIGKDQA